MPYVKPTVQNAQPLLIKQIAAETAALIASEGATILSLAQGTPNLPLFPAAVEAMTAHVQSAKMPYTDVAGIPAVRETAAKFVSTNYTFPAHVAPLSAANVMITAGAAQSVYNCLALSVGCKDDVVLSPLPAYGLYLHQTSILGGTFDAIQTSSASQFKPTVSDLAAAFDKHTYTDAQGARQCRVRSLVLCTPNNPCGTTLTAAEAQAIASFLDAKLAEFPLADFSVVLDEVYVGITAPGVHHSLLSYASPRLVRNCFLVLSVSKGLGAMPGARAGFLTTFDPALLAEFVKIQSACTANACSISQIGLQASLQHVMDHPEASQQVYAYYAERTALCVKRLNEIGSKYFKEDAAAASSSSSSSSSSPAPVAVQPSSTFYVLASFAGWAGMSDDLSIQRWLRDQYKLSAGKIGVACVPGCAFNLDPKLKLVRFSCAVEMDVLTQSMDVVEEAVRLWYEKQAAENK